MINEKKCSLKLQYEASILPITVVYDTLTFLHNSANWRIARSERQHLWHVICSIDEPWCISNWTGGANKHYNHKRRKNMLSVQDWNIGQDCCFRGSELNKTGGGRLLKNDTGRELRGILTPPILRNFGRVTARFQCRTVHKSSDKVTAYKKRRKQWNSLWITLELSMLICKLIK